jgi:hypothetical protein
MKKKRKRKNRKWIIKPTAYIFCFLVIFFSGRNKTEKQKSAALIFPTCGRYLIKN